MDCRIVFYFAKKTSFCERSLKKSFSELGLTDSGTFFATSAESLGGQLIEGFKKSDLVFIIGGLDFDDFRSVKRIISRAVSDTEIDEVKKLKNAGGSDGYVLKAQNQLLVMLPDFPQQIEEIMQGNLSGYIKNFDSSAKML